jgi:diguanylate cyclase (GGDEF)-like protein
MPVHVLLLSKNPDRRSEWRDALSKSPELNVCDATLPNRPSGPLDLVVADRMPIAEDGPELSGPLSRGQLGLVLVGCSGAADVSLPTNCTSRELRLACRLLAEIVRLRRQATRERRARKLLSQLANTDPLTGLENRRAWEDHLHERCRSIFAESRNGCLVLLDLDHFKRVNEQFGLLAGDEVLRRVGQALKRQADANGYAARMGGDEFVLLLAGRDGMTSRELAEQARVAARQKLILDDSPVEITVSAGYAELQDESIDAGGQLLAGADRALREAKQSGRNCSIEGV